MGIQPTWAFLTNRNSDETSVITHKKRRTGYESQMGDMIETISYIVCFKMLTQKGYGLGLYRAAHANGPVLESHITSCHALSIWVWVKFRYRCYLVYHFNSQGCYTC